MIPLQISRQTRAFSVAHPLRCGLLACLWLLLASAAGHARSPVDTGNDRLGNVKRGDVKTGIDVLEDADFAPLRGKRVGLITNQTGVDSRGRRTIDLLAGAQGVKLVAIFSPEHGIAGRANEEVASGTDAPTGLPIYSLYGETWRPTEKMLRGVDALVFDIQDAGVRFYTYITTMAYAMEEAALRGISFYVLDRPNPLGGLRVEGPVLDRDRLNFVGYFPMPVVHGMTVGELARMFNAENHIGADLHVIKMDGWHRRDTFQATGLKWIPPSPNLPTLEALLVYPGVEILQAGGVSVGRGTDKPFELLGAPWIRGAELARKLNARRIPVVRFGPVQFTPGSGFYKDVGCQGVAIHVTDRAALRPMPLGIELAAELTALYPDQFDAAKLIALLGSQDTVARLEKGEAPSSIVRSWQPQLAAFRRMRAKYLLYR
jgi:uncharacterized protein YbbC (DUF1343 family)